ncbi:unnamed protein product [Closterium sp. NIES-54]
MRIRPLKYKPQQHRRDNLRKVQETSTPRRESLQPNPTYAAIAHSEPSGKDTWFVDSCCGQHMCSSRCFVQREHQLQREVVITVANNQNLRTRRQGVLQLQSRETNVILQMSKVLIAEGLGYNLLSVSQLIAKGIHLEADSTTQEFKLYNRKGGLYIGKAVLKNNVFVLDIVPDLGTADSDGIVTFTSWTHPPDLDPDFTPEGFWYSHTIPEIERTRALATIQHSATAETTSAAAETTSAAAETTAAAAAPSTSIAGPSTASAQIDDTSPTPAQQLQKDLTLTVSYTVTQYLGLNIQEGESAIYLNAAKYADTIGKRFALTPTTISTPYRYTAGNNKAGSAPLKPAGIRNYQRKLGCLLFATVTCRPDLSYSASQLATYLKRPEAEHMTELDHALHYLVSTPMIGLIYYKNRTRTPKLIGYVDADHTGDSDNRRSRTGYIYRLEPIRPISWQSSKQELIALSLAEAEYIALCSATKEGFYLRELMEEAKLALLPSFSLFCDNQSAIRIANKNGFANRTKHIALRYFFVKDEIEKGRLELSYCPTSEMAADYLTKKLGKQKFEYCMLLTGQSHVFLLCDRADGLPLFDLTSGASPAPPATADSTVRSQWATRDAAARLAVRRHLPTTERAHFSQYKSAQTLYDAVVTRYSSPATAALSRLMLPYLFPDLAAFPTVADLITHLRTSDTRYRAALPAEFYAKNPPPHSVGAASAPSGRRRTGRGKGGKGTGGTGGGGGGGGGGSGGGWGGGGRGGGGGGVSSSSGGGGGGGGGGGSGGGGGGGGSGGGEGSGGAGRGSTQRSGSGGGQRQQQQRSRETLSPQHLREWYAGRQRGGGTGPCTYVLRTGDRAGEQCGGLHSTQRCIGRLTDAWRHQFPDATEIPRWGDLSRAGVAIFDLDYDAILAAMYDVSTSDEGDCYLCLPPDPSGEAAALGACEAAALGASASAAPGAGESALLGTASAQVFHTFTLDSGASRSFFRDRTTLTPLSQPVAISLADPSGGPCRIGMVMDVARTSMIHAAAPHFLWPFAVQYAAHQLNLQPRVSLPETSPTLRWTGKVGDASAFRVWGSRAFVRDLSADKLSPRCENLGSSSEKRM